MSRSDIADPHISLLRAARKPAARFAALLIAGVSLLIIGLQAVETWRGRDLRLREAEVATANMAHALSAQGETAIRVTDTVLASVVTQVEREGWSGPPGERLGKYLRDVVAEAKEVHGVLVYDADGNWVVNSLDHAMQGNNADREYFRFHKASPQRSAHVGLPILSRSTGVWVLPVSRRINRPDGRFAGVVVATIRIAYFAKLYASFDIGKQGTIVLARDDGTLAYRRPFEDTLIGKSIAGGLVYQEYKRTGPVGNATLPAQLDGIVRLYSYRRMDSYPLLVIVGVSKDDILSGWRSSAGQLFGGIGVVVLMLALVGTRLVRQIRIRDELEKELLSARERLQERNAALTELAERDGLTGISNRRHFEEALQREIARAARSGKPLSLIMLDVDYFKKYNDHYGHVAGDNCLQQIAAVLPVSLDRPSDFPARYGGEEFIVLLPETSGHGAFQVAERIRSSVCALDIEHAGSPAGVVTVSLGVCTARVDADSLPAPEALVEQADCQLYEAKRLGRNRVSIAAQESTALRQTA